MITATLRQVSQFLATTAQLYGKARFADKDLKPALALYYLREMLGKQKFLKETRNFINLWAGKHPSPFDFFNSMRAGAGLNLNWYWNAWYFEKAVPDLAISNVQRNGTNYQITIRNIGGAPVPVHLKVFFKNGQIINKSKTAKIWSDNKASTVIGLQATGEMMHIELGDAYDADVNLKNNVWLTGR